MGAASAVSAIRGLRKIHRMNIHPDRVLMVANIGVDSRRAVKNQRFYWNRPARQWQKLTAPESVMTEVALAEKHGYTFYCDATHVALVTIAVRGVNAATRENAYQLGARYSRTKRHYFLTVVAPLQAAAIRLIQQHGFQAETLTEVIYPR